MPAGIDKNTIIGERYQIKQVLEEGTVSNVYVATDLELGDVVLLRAFSWDFSYEISNADEFRYTITTLSQLAEPSHVRIVDSGDDDELLFTVWPYEDLESLESIIKRRGPLESAMAVSICKELALSLDKAYNAAGVGHYNLTMNNIFINSQGAVRYSDYGIAAQLSNDTKFMKSGFPLWDMQFLSPEMALGWDYPDIRSDIYSLGLILYSMLTGSDAYAGVRNVNEINYGDLEFPPVYKQRLDHNFMDLFYTMIARNPAQRFSSWSEVVTHMDRYLYEEKIRENSVSQSYRAKLTKTFDPHMFDDLDTSKSRRSQSKTRRQASIRMSVEEVKRNLGSKEKSQPSTFAQKAKENRRKANISSKPRNSVKNKNRVKKSSGSLSKTQLNSSSSGHPIKSRQTRTKKKSSSIGTGALVTIIAMALVILIFIVIMVTGKNPSTNNLPNNETVNTAPDNSSKTPDKTESTKVKPDKTVADDTLPEKKEPDKVVPVKTTPKEVPQNEELLALIKEINKGVYSKIPDVADLDLLIDQANELAEGDEESLKAIKKLYDKLALKRPLAIRSTLSAFRQSLMKLIRDKDFDTAITRCEDYDGQYKEELAGDLENLKQSLIARKENQLAIVEKDPEEKTDNGPDKVDEDPVVAEKTVDKPQDENELEVKGSGTLGGLTAKIAAGQGNIALLMFPRLFEIMKDKKTELTMVKSLLLKLKGEAFYSTLLKGYEAEEGNDLSFTVEGKKVKGKLTRVDRFDNKLRMLVDFNGSELLRSYSVKDISPLDNVLRLNSKNENETSLLRTFYLCQIRLIPAVVELEKYEGFMKEEMLQALKNVMTKGAKGEFSKILDNAFLTGFDEKDFEKKLTEWNPPKNDAWVLSYKIKEFTKSNKLTEFFIDNEAKINLVRDAAAKLISKIKDPDFVVSVKGGNDTLTLEEALRKAKGGAQLRLLPGVYSGTIDLKIRSLRLIGATGVVIISPVRISKASVLLEQLLFKGGEITISSEVDNTNIVNCSFEKAGITMLGKNNGTEVLNSHFYGLTVGENKKTSLLHCTVFDRGDKKSPCIKGPFNGNIRNTILYSESTYVFSFKEEDKEPISMKYCLLYGGKSLAYLTDVAESVDSEKDFKKKVARFTNSFFEKPQFRSAVSGDCRLKDFSPGFLAGEKKMNIGVQMNEHLQLLDTP